MYLVQTATALGKLGHPDGELNLTRAAAKHGVIQMVRFYLSVSDVYTTVPHTRWRISQIPTLASCSFDELVDGAEPGQVQFMQLCVRTPCISKQTSDLFAAEFAHRYVNKDREITKRIVQHAEKRGVKGLFITVDAPQLGRREKDMRMKFDDDGAKVQQGDNVDRNQGAARAISVRETFLPQRRIVNA